MSEILNSTEYNESDHWKKEVVEAFIVNQDIDRSNFSKRNQKEQ